METGKDKRDANQLVIDFTSGAVAHRRRFGGGRGQHLPKAIGMKGGKNPHVIDATAGLGRDAFLLASLGATVTMIERSNAVFEQLEQALTKAKAFGAEPGEIVSRMSLIHGDAKELLPQLVPEVVLIDPMHPARKSTALVKKEMRLIRQIVGADDDSAQLLEIGLAHARNRVVLKWPRKAKALPNIIAPSHQIIGKSTRYDVFMTNKG